LRHELFGLRNGVAGLRHELFGLRDGVAGLRNRLFCLRNGLAGLRHLLFSLHHEVIIFRKRFETCFHPEVSGQTGFVNKSVTKLVSASQTSFRLERRRKAKLVLILRLVNLL